MPLPPVARLIPAVALTLAVLTAAVRADEKTCEKRGKAAEVTVHEFDKVKVNKYPWGWIRWVINDQTEPGAEMTFGIVHVEPNQDNPLHLHPGSTEYLHVLSGSCEHRVGDQWVKVKAGDTIRIPKGEVHCARTGKEHCRAIIVYNTGKRRFIPVKEDK